MKSQHPKGFTALVGLALASPTRCAKGFSADVARVFFQGPVNSSLGVMIDLSSYARDANAG